MKKLYSHIGLLFLTFLIFIFPIVAHAENENNDTPEVNTEISAENTTDLVTDLAFDPETRMLSGYTAPNANIYVADIVMNTNIVADENGHFEIPIPKEIQQSTITIMDAIGDQSTDIDYDFEEGKIFSEAVEADSQNSQTESTPSTSSTAVTTPSSGETILADKKLEEKKSKLTLIIAIVLALILLLILCLFLLYRNKKKEKEAKAKRRKKQKKTRHSSTMPSRSTVHHKKKKKKDRK